MEVAVNKGTMKRRNEVNIRREHHEAPGASTCLHLTRVHSGFGVEIRHDKSESTCLQGGGRMLRRASNKANHVAATNA